MKLTREQSEHYKAVPISETSFYVEAGDANVKSTLKMLFGSHITFEEVDEHTLQMKRAVAYHMDNKPLQLKFNGPITRKERLSFSSEAESAEALDQIVSYAVDMDASDIHFDALSDEVVVRIRVDGILRDVAVIEKEYFKFMATRIKILAHLDYTIRNHALDGRFSFTYHDQAVDIRVAITPTAFGEKIVLRILDRSHVDFTLDGIGLGAEEQQIVKRLLHQPSGLILVCGPTGSGKSSTLYTLLKALYNRTTNIMTIEDPVEYKIEGINQIEIAPELGRSFNTGLKSILRLDPDKIMVGEIRDAETAQTALRAAITGHLVFSTLHVSDSPSAIYRLRDMGIEPYLLAAGLVGVISQRLVRKLCSCKVATQSYVELFDKTMTHFEPTGCDLCHDGYRGRQAVFELLVLNDALREKMVQPMSLAEFRKAAAGQTVTLKQSLETLVTRGVTSVEEVYKNILTL
ncbi:GspE/PulE family protein [Peptoniphilus equinus]|uniref:GspE/PulE family protein n=1 Tax=Peptoniphilus equinus TaxID=3016343 RepID=A0ABY7QS47_9FIRM|nr:GspE/PulE family protein [Peptoniphilus equinus]WBW49286.1 GspE/PulE family protein [Peptoniphilus equinus]